jgi:hypothetical protein
MVVGYFIINYYYKKEENEDRDQKPANGFTPFFNKIVAFFSGIQPKFFGGAGSTTSGPSSISGPVAPISSSGSLISSSGSANPVSGSGTETNAFYNALNTSSQSGGGKHAEPDNSFSGIQSKAGWCYIGEEKGIRSCAEVGTNDRCMSGDIFPTKEICVNPKLRA